MVILVCGDRNWNDVGLIHHYLAKYSPTKVIHGGCRGADQISGILAKELGIPVQVFEADWSANGRAAGPIRNQRMLDESRPDLVLAFHNDIGSSRGTADMIRRAKKAGIQVELVVEPV